MAKRNGKKRRKRRSSFGRSVALLVVASLLVVVLLLVVSTCKRKKAAAEALWDGSWYADELGRVQDEKELISGLKAFYRRTGERPFLAMLGNLSPEDLDVYTEDLYGALFADSGHLLVVYDEWGDGLYYLSCRRGADSPLTEADETALLDCLERAYADGRNDSYGAAFGAGFREAAKQMSVEKLGNGATVVLLSLAAVLALLGVLLLALLRKNARRAARLTEDDG